MSQKNYSTKQQRETLAMAGIEHVPGRSYAEAHRLIQECIEREVLPADILDGATQRQLAVLDKIGVEYPASISRDEASKIIDRHTPPTEKQLEFLLGLGAEIPSDIPKQSASELIDQYTRLRPMSNGQAGFIAELGGVVTRSMTYHNASQFIEQLLENEFRCARCGGLLSVGLLAAAAVLSRMS